MTNNSGEQKLKKLPTPEKIKEYLDNYVIGQEEAKKVLSVAVYNHYKRIIYNNYYSIDTEIEKTNCIILGETGSGKTMLIKTVARLLGVPYYIQDTTKLTASGYVGSDVEDCIAGLLRACNYDIQAAECGIVILDEGDKIARKGAGPSITRDVSGECVQQSLLKIVEGDLVGVNPAGGRKHPDQPLTYVDTKNILFILTGAFVGLEDIVKKRLGHTRIGFDREESENIVETDSLNEYVTSEDIKEFGFIPEFVGRFPVITSVNKLTIDDLKRILTEPKNAVTKQYQELLSLDNTELEFTDDAITKIAEIANEQGTGARALRAIVDCVMLDVMYTAPKNTKKKTPVKVTIDSNYVMEKTNKKFKNKEAA